MISSLALVALIASAYARFPPGLQEALQLVANAKSLQYNCSISVSLLSSDDVVSVAGSPHSRARTSDKFAFGSGTKPLTGASILKLVSDGKFGLDAPVAPLVDPIIKKIT